MSSIEAAAVTDEQMLWRCWLSHRDAAIRTKLFFFYSPWARLLARQVMACYPHPLAEWQDYANLSSMGLLQAIDRFDATVQTRFQSYAERYVKGSILKGLSCYVRDRQRVSRDRLDSFSGDGRFDANDGDLEQVVNAAVDMAFGYFLELGIVNAEPIDNSPFCIYQQGHRDQMLADMIHRLPEREQQVIVGHYYQHLSFIELSQLLDVSKSRISQLHTQALKRVRSFYEALDEVDRSF
ncbi:MAG: sigma-70 family RNA polymerase sigma factor [Pseudomonadota bacterium]